MINWPKCPHNAVFTKTHTNSGFLPAGRLSDIKPNTGTAAQQQILVPGVLVFDLAMLSQALGELTLTEPRTGYCFMFFYDLAREMWFL